METKETEILERDVEKGIELYSALMDALDGKDLVMSTQTFIAALAKFLSDMADIAENFGTTRETFIRNLMLVTKKVDMLKDSQKTGKTI